MDSSGSLTALEVNGPLDALHPGARSPPRRPPNSRPHEILKAALEVSGADLDPELAASQNVPRRGRANPYPAK